MANGDAAAAAGMDVVAGTSDLRQGYDEINKTRDYLADHQTSGTHPASAINSGVFDAARIPPIGQLNGGGLTLTPSGSVYAASGGLSVAAGFAVGGSAAVGSNLDVAGTLTNATAYGSVVSSGRTLAVRSDGSFGYFPSARRFKKNITDAAIDPEGVLRLRPVEFDYLKKYGGGHDIGLIAEEVAEEFPWLVYDGDDDGQVDGIAYERLVVPLIAAVQALAARVTELEKGES